MSETKNNKTPETPYRDVIVYFRDPKASSSSGPSTSGCQNVDSVKADNSQKDRAPTPCGPSTSDCQDNNSIQMLNPAAVEEEEQQKKPSTWVRSEAHAQICAYTGYDCNQPAISGRQYCYAHILEDRTAPYMQCISMLTKKIRCPNPAPYNSEEPRDLGMCFEHACRELKSMTHSVIPPAPVTSTETLLNNLKHHVTTEPPKDQDTEKDDQEQANLQGVDPFIQIDARDINASYSSSIMDCASRSDSDGDSVTLGDNGNSPPDPEDLSDAEDAPCEESPLWRARVFTEEEAVKEQMRVILQLRSGYIKQMEYLKVELEMCRLKYLRDLAIERQQHCSIHTQAQRRDLTDRERRQLKKLKAYASYHRKHGSEAVLAWQRKQKRAQLANPRPNQIPHRVRCLFREGGVQCPEKVLPAAKFCIKHILQDKRQVLFAACGDTRGDLPCQEPIPKLPVPSTKCRYHTDPSIYEETITKPDLSTETESSSSDEEFDHKEASKYVDKPKGDNLRPESIPKPPSPMPSCSHHTDPPIYNFKYIPKTKNKESYKAASEDTESSEDEEIEVT